MKNMQKQYSEFQKRFKAMSDKELIDTFNGDVGKPVWINARAQFHDALRGEFDNRGFDYSSLGSIEKGSFDIGHKIELIGKKIIKQNMNTTKIDSLVEEFNKRAQAEGRLIQKKPQGLQVVFGAKGPTQKFQKPQK